MISIKKLKWAIGMNIDVEIVNLTTKNRNLIAYACSHVIILYDYVSKDIMSLQGHQNAVSSLSASRDGKWLLSADYGQDSVCIVWDTETRVPICSLFNPHKKYLLTAAKLSPDAKYLVTVGNEESQIVKFWLWTYGKEIPDATVELSETSAERARKISFNDNHPEEFVLTLDQSVIFASWTNTKNLKVYRPKISQKKSHLAGNFNDSCFLSKFHRALTATSNGFVLVWGNAVCDEEFENRRSSDERRFVKMVKLQKGNLTHIENYKQIIVVGNDSGQLYFYDHQLKLLYWCKDFGVESIVSLSFDRESNLRSPEIPPSESTISESDVIEEISILDSTDEDEMSKSSNLKDQSSHDEDAEESILESMKNEAEKTKKISYERPESKTQILSSNSDFKKMKNLTASNITINIDHGTKNSKIPEPTDCTLQSASFVVPNFFISSGSGKIARLDIPSLKCRFITHPTEGPITAIASRPESDYMITGNSLGILSLYKYTTRSRMVMKKTPALPNFAKLLSFENGKLDMTYVTCPQIQEGLVAVTALRFSPAKDGILACGLENGVIWILHSNTLDPIDPNPYKHSASSITDIVFTESGEYFAYSDDAFIVGVFRKNETKKDKNLWCFLGKYRSHTMPICQILWIKPALGKFTPRLMSLGEDQNLVEYDLKNSGPYPEPGLIILQIDKIESDSLPLCMSAYPEFGVENFIIIGNSQYKLRLINDQTKTIRTTILGPTVGDPVQQLLVPNKIHSKRQNRGYMIFSTSKEIGLLILPFDGNPYKIVAMIGHPKKIKSMTISDCGKYLFTIGENDRGVLMWRINYRSVDTMERFGGNGLAPFYSQIDGGKNGWLVNEMKDLFYYSQILQNDENTTAMRIVSDKVSILQLPNLMRSIGFYPTNDELETMMEEVSYGNYAETGKLVEDINFEDFVKLYVNHRPAYGVTTNQIRDAFRTFAKSDDLENPNLTSEQFLEVLLGRGTNLYSADDSDDKLYGEPLTVEEAHTYLRRLLPQDEDSTSFTGSRDDRASKAELNFEFLPQNISYKTFTEEILGIDTSEVSKSEDEILFNEDR